MNEETLRKAEKLSKEIEKLRETLHSISYHQKHAKKDKSCSRYNWMLRVFNNKKDDGTKEPKMYLFDNDDIHGSDIPIDEGLLTTITEYFKSKLVEKEKQFSELS